MATQVTAAILRLLSGTGPWVGLNLFKISMNKRRYKNNDKALNLAI